MVNRYRREGECNRCGWCCSHENCENFVMENGIATCLIHGCDRELKCTLYPSAPPIVHEGCGYFFVDTLENDAVIKRVVD